MWQLKIKISESTRNKRNISLGFKVPLSKIPFLGDILF